MSQYTHPVVVESGAQSLYGVWSYTLTSTSDNFLPDDDLTCAGTGATGKVISYSSGSKELRFYITSTEQPATGEVVVGSGTLSGTLAVQNEAPSFVGNVAAPDLFFIPGEASYEVGSVPTRSHVLLASSYAASSKSDVSGYFNDSFTTNYGAALPEAGIQNAAEIIRRGLVTLDEAISTASGNVASALQTEFDGIDGAFSSSLTISGVPVATGTGVTDHGALTGLSGDDHTQYTLADGTRPFTGTASGTNLNLSEQLSAQSGAFSTSLTVSGVPVSTGGSSGGIQADGSVPFTGDQSMGGNELTDLGRPSDADVAAPQGFGFITNYITAVMGDDTVTQIDNAPANGIMVIVVQPIAATAQGLVTYNTSQTSTTIAGGSLFENLTAGGTPPSATGGTDSRLQIKISTTTGQFWLVNRLANTMTVRIWFLSGHDLSSTAVTATGL